MDLKLWSRREGIVPPPEPRYAEPGSRVFPPALRTRVFEWSRDALLELQHGTPMGDVINDFDTTTAFLASQLRAAYGRDPLAVRRGPVGTSADSLPVHQLQLHVASCPDLEILDYVDAVFQVSAYIVERFGGALLEEEVERLGARINQIFEEEGIGYRWIDGRLVRFDGEITHELAIVPALTVLATGHFGSAQAEFDGALSSFRRGDYRDTLTHANAAFESVSRT
jgi:hypothetical protein